LGLGLLRFRVLELTGRVVGLRIFDFGFRIQGAGIYGLGLRVLGLRVLGSKI